MQAKHNFHNSYRNPVCRSWHSNQSIKDTNLIFPVFVTNTEDEKTEITSMPGNFRYGYKKIVEELRPLIERPRSHLRSIMIFGVMQTDEKDDTGRCIENSPVTKALPLLRQAFPDLLLGVDLCLCAYTNSGHCGIMRKDGTINLQKSQKSLASAARIFASYGAQMICPSDMMDGRIHFIRQELLNGGFDVPIMSYSTKFHSSFYGPFRDAAQSAPSFGDRATYQLPPYARDLGIRAALRDVEEGADFVMVKPGMPYLDLIRDLKNSVQVPIACYQVSGEFAMLFHAAKAGAIDLKRAVLESMTGFLRAGATIVITYFVPQLLDWIEE
jgi:porphobilinogen synthase